MVEYSPKCNENYDEDRNANGWEKQKWIKWWETSWPGQSQFADTIKEDESEVFGSQGRGVFPRPALVVNDQTCGLAPPHTWLQGSAHQFQRELCEDQRVASDSEPPASAWCPSMPGLRRHSNTQTGRSESIY